MSYKAIIFSAPSGAGKTTIVRYLLNQGLPLEFSISACSRPPRSGEKDGKDYYFLSSKKFKQNIFTNAFVEWEEVYEDMFYGTLKSEINRIWENEKTVIFDVDVFGGLKLKKALGEKALAIFIAPPSIEELGIRLKNRGTETSKSLAKRLSKAKKELAKKNDFDFIVINNNLEIACQKTLEKVRNFLNS